MQCRDILLISYVIATNHAFPEIKRVLSLKRKAHSVKRIAFIADFIEKWYSASFIELNCQLDLSFELYALRLFRS